MGFSIIFFGNEFEIGKINQEGIFTPHYHISINLGGFNMENEMRYILMQKSLENYFYFRFVNIHGNNLLQNFNYVQNYTIGTFFNILKYKQSLNNQNKNQNNNKINPVSDKVDDTKHPQQTNSIQTSYYNNINDNKKDNSFSKDDYMLQKNKYSETEMILKENDLYDRSQFKQKTTIKKNSKKFKEYYHMEDQNKNNQFPANQYKNNIIAKNIQNNNNFNNIQKFPNQQQQINNNFNIQFMNNQQQQFINENFQFQNNNNIFMNNQQKKCINENNQIQNNNFQNPQIFFNNSQMHNNNMGNFNQQINKNENPNNLYFNNMIEINKNKENVDINEIKEKLNQEKKK